MKLSAIQAEACVHQINRSISSGVNVIIRVSSHPVPEIDAVHDNINRSVLLSDPDSTAPKLMSAPTAVGQGMIMEGGIAGVGLEHLELAPGDLLNRWGQGVEHAAELTRSMVQARES